MIERTRLYEHVAVAIRQQIVAGALRVGQRLQTERELAELHGVSRNVVREAVRMLVREGLIEVKQGSGTYVKDGTSKALGESFSLAFALGGSPDVLAHLVEARLIIEPTLASLAAERASPQDIKELWGIIDEMDAAAMDAEEFIAADQRFHHLIAKASRNSAVPLMLDPIVDLLKVQRERAFRVEDTGAAQKFHRQILDAIERRDSKSAFNLMTAHLVVVGEGIARLS